MVYLLRHITFRIWCTVILGGLLCLWVLPLVQTYTGVSKAVLPAAAILLSIFMLSGRLSARIGIRRVERIITEAAAWERAGRTREAENAYKKAVSVFDSCLLSPAVQKQTGAHLIALLARFYLARAEGNAQSEAFILAYLNAHPEDREVAESWLLQMTHRDRLPDTYQAVAHRIGNAQPDHDAIQVMLARLYLSEGRCDFQALQTYRRVFGNGGKSASELIPDLASVFLGAGRADEWALDIYLQAYRMEPRRQALLNGIAAGAHWMPAGGKSKRIYTAARQLLKDVDDLQLAQMRSGFNPPAPAGDPPSHLTPGRLSIFKRGCRLFLGLAEWAYPRCRALLMSGARRLRITVRSVRDFRHTRQILKWTGIAAAAFGMLFMVVNTAGYLFKTRTESDSKVTVAITDPFTLQVAAYLKPEHAERYVAFLKKHALDAYWTEASGKKKKWYQVRIYHFADKQSAIAYGNSLKAKGIIDDFYVANYARP